MTAEAQTGRCLCGAVRYRVRGPLRDVIICHCDDCRRWHGHVCATTAARRADVSIEGEDALRWFTVPGAGPRPRRGFCAQCGSSLFWDAPGRGTLSIAAGTLDPPTRLRTIAHIYVEEAGDYERGGESDGLARYPRAAPAGIVAVPSD